MRITYVLQFSTVGHSRNYELQDRTEQNSAVQDYTVQYSTEMGKPRETNMESIEDEFSYMILRGSGYL